MSKAVEGRIKTLACAIETREVAPSGALRITGYASKPTVDRYLEVIDARAFEKTIDIFRRNPIMLLNHKTEDSIGTWDRMEIRGDGLFVSGLVGRGFEPADTTRKKVDQGILRSLSVGFRPVQAEFDDNDELFHYREAELLEISVVAVPANRDAMFVMDENNKLADIKELDEITDAESLVRRWVFLGFPDKTIQRQVNATSELMAQIRNGDDALDLSTIKFLPVSEQTSVAPLSETEVGVTSAGAENAQEEEADDILADGDALEAQDINGKSGSEDIGSGQELRSAVSSLTVGIDEIKSKLVGLDDLADRVADLELALSGLVEERVESLTYEAVQLAVDEQSSNTDNHSEA